MTELEILLQSLRTRNIAAKIVCDEIRFTPPGPYFWDESNQWIYIRRQDNFAYGPKEIGICYIFGIYDAHTFPAYNTCVNGVILDGPRDQELTVKEFEYFLQFFPFYWSHPESHMGPVSIDENYLLALFARAKEEHIREFLWKMFIYEHSFSILNWDKIAPRYIIAATEIAKLRGMTQNEIQSMWDKAILHARTAKAVSE
jgi:hypothetical protein